MVHAVRPVGRASRLVTLSPTADWRFRLPPESQSTVRERRGRVPRSRTNEGEAEDLPCAWWRSRSDTTLTGCTMGKSAAGSRSKKTSASEQAVDSGVFRRRAEKEATGCPVAAVGRPSGHRALRSPSARRGSVWLIRRETWAEPVLSDRAVASGAEAGGGVAALEAVEEGVGAGESAARPPVSRPEPARARSCRVVVLGRRVARGGHEREAKPSPTTTNTSARMTVPAPERRAQLLAVLRTPVRVR